MSLTITTYSESYNPPVSIILREENSQLKQIAQDAFQKLYQLLLIYEEWNDPLSEKLQTWTIKVIELAVDKSLKRGDLQAKLLERINQLTRQILINPVTHLPYIEPILIHQTEIQEKQAFEETLRILQMKVEGIFILHAYAIAMINWVKELKTDLKSKGFINEENNEFKNQQLVLAMKKARKALERSNQALVNYKQESHHLLNQHLEVIQLQNQAHEKQLQIKLNQIENLHQERVKVLKNRLNHQFSAITHLEQEVVNTKKAYQKEKIANINLQQEIQQNLEMAIKREEVTRVNLRNLKTQHEKNYQVLDQKIIREEKRHDKTWNELLDQQNVCLEQQESITALKQSNAHLYQQLYDLQNQDDSSCQIM